MGRLDQLIQELCPEGVVYKPLSAITKYSQERIIASDLDASSYVGVDNLIPEKKGKTDSNFVPCEGHFARFNAGDILIGNIRPYLRKIWLATHSGGTNGDVLVFHIINREIIEPEFLYYLLSSEHFFEYDTYNSKGAKMPRGDKAAVMNYIVPIPPLPVQQEIVRILDRFTGLSDELITELSAELSARKRQFNNYHDKLMSFGDNVKIEPLGEEFPFIRNGFVGTVTPFFTDEKSGIRYLQGTNVHNGIISDNVEFYVTKEFHQKHIRSELNSDDILVVQSGHVGECAVVGEKYTGANCHALIVMSNGGRCNSNFIVHYLQSQEGIKKLNAITTGGTIKHILASKIKNVLVPIPSLEEQVRIVEFLDRYTANYQELNIEITAEIESRRKQYEYYRDKLLTFKEKPA